MSPPLNYCPSCHNFKHKQTSRALIQFILDIIVHISVMFCNLNLKFKNPRPFQSKRLYILGLLSYHSKTIFCWTCWVSGARKLQVWQGVFGFWLQGNESPEEHGLCAWDAIISKAAAKHILIVAHSYGGIVTTELVSPCYTPTHCVQFKIFLWLKINHNLLRFHVRNLDMQSWRFFVTHLDYFVENCSVKVYWSLCECWKADVSCHDLHMLSPGDQSHRRLHEACGSCSLHRLCTQFGHAGGPSRCLHLLWKGKKHFTLDIPWVRS